MITMYERERQITPFRLAGAFRRVKEELGLRESPIIDREFCPIHRNVQPGKVKEGSLSASKSKLTRSLPVFKK
jgi:hypothetical protein